MVRGGGGRRARSPPEGPGEAPGGARWDRGWRGGDRGGAAGGPAAGPGPVRRPRALSRPPGPAPAAARTPPVRSRLESRGHRPGSGLPPVPYGLLAAPCPPRPREEAPRGVPGLRHTGGRPARPRPCRPRWLPGFGLLRPPRGLPEGGFGEGTGGLTPCGTRNLGGRPRLRRSRCLFTPRGAVLLPGLQPAAGARAEFSDFVSS